MGIFSGWRKSEAVAGGKVVATIAVVQSGETRYAQILAACPGAHTSGEAANVDPGITATLVSITVPLVPTGTVLRLWGFEAIGTGDGRIALAVDGAEIAARVCSQLRPDPTCRFPAPHDVAGDSEVTLKVTNTGLAAADYRALLYAE